MSRISAWGVSGSGYQVSSRPHSSTGQSGQPSSGVATSASDVFSSGLSRSDLLAMNAGIDQASRTSNALSTANDAIGVIGGLLGSVQYVLDAACGAKDRSFDAPSEQARIDGAITTMDAIATSTRFGGQKLLDGTFHAAASTDAVTIGSFVSSTLGSSSQGDAALGSMMSGGANDLASGKLASAHQIVATAMSQVGQTQSQITAVLAAGRETSNEPSAQSHAARDMLADPSAASDATANSPAARVLALLA
jgi:flagellin-like hook-associated protein FlgL